MSKRRPKRGHELALTIIDESKPSLLDAIDALTKPRAVTNWQGTEIVKHTHVSLLEALRTAVTSPDAVAGSGATSPQARSLLDIRALETLERIVLTARSWISQLGGTFMPDEDAVALLRRFHRLLIAKPWAPTVADDYARVVEGWASDIEAVIDPPRRIELGTSDPRPCPRCGEEWVLTGHTLLNGKPDPNDSGWVRALAIFERSTANESYAECGACRARWKGVYAMRQLSAELDDAETATTIETTGVNA